ncbi:MAG: cytochrome c biogenesis protein CcsA [Acidobacteria bacterium]|nr:cytochrome c biogenesis protein CcsA [Acidobacteriota bacterium]
MSLLWLRLATALYMLALLQAVLSLLRHGDRLFPLALRAFQLAAVFHFVSIVEHSIALHTVAANNFFETASLAAFLFALAYLFLEWRYHFAVLSVFVFPLVAVLTLIGATAGPSATWTDTRLRGALLVTHILLVLIGLSGLLFSAAASVFYLLQERRLKRRHVQPGWLTRVASDRLPPLEDLDNLITRSMNFGFVAITLAVAAASSWASIEYGTRWITQPAIVVSLITWAFYLVMVFLRLSAGWRGRRAALLSLTVLCFSVLTWAAHVGLRPLLEK